MTELLIGTFLALGALMFVLYPLMSSDGAMNSALGTLADQRQDPARNSAVDALREIEFDRATGKLSESDYDQLKSSYTQRALAYMRSSGGAICEVCGPRPEGDAQFCSNCGRPLAR